MSLAVGSKLPRGSEGGSGGGPRGCRYWHRCGLTATAAADRRVHWDAWPPAGPAFLIFSSHVFPCFFKNLKELKRYQKEKTERTSLHVLPSGAQNMVTKFGLANVGSRAPKHAGRIPKEEASKFFSFLYLLFLF